MDLFNKIIKTFEYRKVWQKFPNWLCSITIHMAGDNELEYDKTVLLGYRNKALHIFPFLIL